MKLKERINVFWAWFEKNWEDYFHLIKDNEILFDELEEQLYKINKGLAFEFSCAIINGKRKFIISANGIKERIPFVLALIKSAPNLAKFHIIAFRPSVCAKKDKQLVHFRGVSLKCSDVFFCYEKNTSSDVIDIDLHIRGYQDNDAWLGASFIFLDRIIGELNVMTKMGGIKRKLLTSEKEKRLLSSLKLPKIVAQVKGHTMETIFNISKALKSTSDQHHPTTCSSLEKTYYTKKP